MLQRDALENPMTMHAQPVCHASSHNIVTVTAGYKTRVAATQILVSLPPVLAAVAAGIGVVYGMPAPVGPAGCLDGSAVQCAEMSVENPVLPVQLCGRAECSNRQWQSHGNASHSNHGVGCDRNLDHFMLFHGDHYLRPLRTHCGQPLPLRVGLVRLAA